MLCANNIAILNNYNTLLIFSDDVDDAIHRKIELAVNINPRSGLNEEVFLNSKVLNSFPKKILINSEGNIDLEFGSKIL